ncbi:MAG: hypothetical protein NVSMB51_06180 [Solirubrobacteraceae bacterium]
MPPRPLRRRSTPHAARRTPDARLLRYPGGHFDIYVGAGFERTIANQEQFLRETVLAPPVVVGRI